MDIRSFVFVPVIFKYFMPYLVQLSLFTFRFDRFESSEHTKRFASFSMRMTKDRTASVLPENYNVVFFKTRLMFTIVSHIVP